jgi:hypothetical protein
MSQAVLPALAAHIGYRTGTADLSAHARVIPREAAPGTPTVPIPGAAVHPPGRELPARSGRRAGTAAPRCARRRRRRFRQDAGVRDGGQDDRGVAELVLYDFQVDPGSQGERRGTVPEPVQGDRRQPGGGDQLREQAGHRVRRDLLTGAVSKHVSGLGSRQPSARCAAGPGARSAPRSWSCPARWPAARRHSSAPGDEAVTLRSRSGITYNILQL